jgi:O-antigen ligase
MYVLLLILLIDLIKTEEQLILLEKSFVLVTVILAIYTIIFAEQFIIEDALYLDIERSFWNDPNYLGSFMSFGIIISVYHILDLNRNFFKSIFYTVVIIVGFMALGILASRGAIISSIIPIIYLLFKKNNSVKKILINFLIVIIITYIGLSYVSTDALISRFNDDSLSKGNGRLIIWEKSLNIFSSSDYLTLLFGGGTNYSLEICGKAMGINIYSPHNNFLQILYDYGIVGFGFFVFFMGIVYLKIRKNLLGVALFFSFLITCFSLVPFMYMPFWFLLTFIIGCIKIENISKFF